MRRASLVGVAAAAVIAIVAAAPAGAAVQVGSSGWLWGNPLPQGNTVNALSFAGQTGYAAGDFGTILRTGDGGATRSGTGAARTVAHPPRPGASGEPRTPGAPRRRRRRVPP